MIFSSSRVAPALFSLGLAFSLSLPTLAAPYKTEHVVMVVWDGLRPDSVTAQNTPILFQLAQGGVTFASHHPVYPSSTEVNGTALATGLYPVHSTIIGNVEYRPDINPLKPVSMEDLDVVRKGDAVNPPYIAGATVAEIVQGSQSRTSVAGSKGVTLLADRSDDAHRTTSAAQSSADVFAGEAIPAAAHAQIEAEQGGFPPKVEYPNSKQDAWTTAALTQTLWKTGVPKYSVLWLSDVDYTQHETAPGSPTSLLALKSCDDQLAKVLVALDAKGARATTSVLVVSDHGFSTIGQTNDLVTLLGKAGFSAKAKYEAPPKQGEIVVVGLGGSAYFYVGGHDKDVTKRLVEYLQTTDFCGVLFTQAKAKGTFALKKVNINSAAAPDVAMSFRWSSAANTYGVPGTIWADFKRKSGQGAHASLSRFDMHNTLIANGPDFRPGFVDTTPSGNTDLAPTILRLLNLQAPAKMDGRVLTEALNGSTSAPAVQSGQLDTQNGNWSQYLKWQKVGKTVYFDEGNGGVGK